jgi:hypothetical protein
MHRTLSAGPQVRFEEGAQGHGLRPLASDSNVRATELPNALLGTSKYASMESPFLSGQNPESCWTDSATVKT